MSSPKQPARKLLNEMLQILDTCNGEQNTGDIIQEIIDSGAPALVGLNETKYRAKLMTLDPETLMVLHGTTQSEAWRELRERRERRNV
jgi:hypothetical protein